MKQTIISLLLAVLATGVAKAADPSAPGTVAPPAAPDAAVSNAAANPSEQATATSSPAALAQPEGNVTNMPAAAVNNHFGEGLHLNFRGVPLDLVLNYLSEAAGFIIVLDAQPKGKVDVWSNQPVTKEEAVELLNSVLNKNGLAAIRRGRTLTIINKDEAKTKALPVRSGSEPNSIPDNDEMVTQIIPVRFVEVTQLIKDLQPLVSTQTAMTANESGNSIVITDTQANIRRVAEVIKAIDMGAEDMTVVRVFHLQHADPQETADLLSNLFPDDSRSGNNQAPLTFGGPGGFRRFFGGGGPGGGGLGGGNQAGGNGGQNQRIKKRNRVIAVADSRTSSVVVTATKDLMDQIESVIAELDPDPANQKAVAVLPLQNAEPQDAMQVLQDIFQKSGTQNNRNAQNQNNALQSRSTQQSQQYNNNNNAARMGTGVGARGTGGFGQ
jgi:type II secretory pathway component GspD/PulD (secretin)